MIEYELCTLINAWFYFKNYSEDIFETAVFFLNRDINKHISCPLYLKNWFEFKRVKYIIWRGRIQRFDEYHGFLKGGVNHWIKICEGIVYVCKKGDTVGAIKRKQIKDCRPFLSILWELFWCIFIREPMSTFLISTLCFYEKLIDVSNTG